MWNIYNLLDFISELPNIISMVINNGVNLLRIQNRCLAPAYIFNYMYFSKLKKKFIPY